MPHATGQLSPGATATEPVLHSKRSHHDKQLTHCSQRVASAHHNCRKLTHSSEDPAQSKLNEIFFLILFLNFTNCISFAKYQNESATGIHVFPILNPPPSAYHPSGSSQCTSPKHPVSCIEPGLATRFIHDIIKLNEILKKNFKTGEQSTKPTNKPFKAQPF